MRIKKIGKSLLALFMSLCLMGTMLVGITIPVSAASNGTTGSCAWSLDCTTLTISGSGAMGDYTHSSSAPWGTDITKVVVEEGVTTVGNYAFYKCTKLESVTLPNSITKIGAYAFYDCNSLTNITVPDGVTSIGYNAFAYSSALESISIPDGVTDIDYYTFYGCESLENIILPESIESIGYGAFYNCKSLVSINIPANVTFIDESAFSGCEKLAGVNYCGTFAQWNKISIGTDNTYLTSATRQYGHKYVWLVDEPATCSKDGIKHEECAYCLSLRNEGTVIKATGEHIYYDTCDADCNVCGQIRTSAHEYDNECDTQCNLCGNIRTNPHWINASTAENSKRYPFALNDGIYRSTNGCDSDAVFTVTALYDHTVEISYCYSTKNGEGYGFFNIKRNSVRMYGGNQYSWKTVTVDLSAGDILQIIFTKDGTWYTGNDAVGYFKIKSLVPADTCQPTCDKAVVCDVCGETVKEALSHNYQNEICTVCGETSAWSYTVENDSATITDYTGTQTELTIPSTLGGYSVTGIGSYALSDCSDITSITIPESVTSIGSFAFANCSSLTGITVPCSVTSIGFSAFANCSSLETVSIHDNVTSISSRVFFECTNLKSVYYCGTAEQWNSINIGSENTYLTNAAIYYEHNYKWVVDKSATCSEDGVKHEECTVCHVVRNADTAIDATGEHTFDNACDTKCNVCGEVRSITHDYVTEVHNATCSETGEIINTCSICGNVVREEIPVSHSYNDGVVTAPTKSAQGYTTYTCSSCGNTYKNSYTDATGTVNGVQNMQVTATDTNITVTWDSYSGATKYNLYVKDETGKTVITRALDADQTSVTLSWPNELEWDKNYTVGIAAKATKWLTTVWKDAALAVGSRIVDVKTESVGRTIKVTWKAYEGATQYYVYVYEKGAAKPFTSVKSATNSATVINSINPEVDYEVRVVATKGVSMKTADALVISARLGIFTPASFWSRGIASNKAAVSWDEVRGAYKYWVYFTSVDSGETITKESKKAIAAVGGLTPDTTYEVKVQVSIIDADGNTHYSGASEVLGTITTESWDTLNFTAKVNSSKKAELSWTKPANAYKYTIYYSTDGGKTVAKMATITDSEKTSCASQSVLKTNQVYLYAIVIEERDDFVSSKSELIWSNPIVNAY